MIFRIQAKNVAIRNKAAVCMSRLTFCQKKFCRKIIQLFRNFRGKTSEFRRESVWKRFLREQILHKKRNSNHLLTLGEKVSNFSPKVPSRAVTTAFYVSKGWILRKKFWKNRVLWFSRTPRKTFWTLGEEFFAGLSILHFTRPKVVFGRNFCLEYAPHIHGFEAIIGAGLLHKTFR